MLTQQNPISNVLILSSRPHTIVFFVKSYAAPFLIYLNNRYLHLIKHPSLLPRYRLSSIVHPKLRILESLDFGSGYSLNYKAKYILPKFESIRWHLSRRVILECRYVVWYDADDISLLTNLSLRRLVVSSTPNLLTPHVLTSVRTCRTFC